jgi:hypothetical protein
MQPKDFYILADFLWPNIYQISGNISSDVFLFLLIIISGIVMFRYSIQNLTFNNSKNVFIYFLSSTNYMPTNV